MSNLEVKRSPTREEMHQAVRAHIVAQLPEGIKLPESFRVTILTMEAARPGVDHIIYNCRTVLPGWRTENEFDLEWPLEIPIASTQSVSVFERAPRQEALPIGQLQGALFAGA